VELASAQQQKLDFINLLVTELQNQNPLEPMNNQQMAAQLAQFTQLELTEDMNKNIGSMNESMDKLNASFRGAMLVAEFDYARSLLGRTVSFYSQEHQQQVTGTVRKVRTDATDGKTTLDIEGRVRYPNGELSDTLSLPVDIHDITEVLM